MNINEFYILFTIFYILCFLLTIIIIEKTNKKFDKNKKIEVKILKELGKLKQESEKLKQESENLKSDNLQKARLLEMFDTGKYRNKYLKERRKEEPNLLYPDSDEVYKRYYEQKKQINLMAKYIDNIQECPLENCDTDLDCENRCSNDKNLTKECWKMYFEKKIKGDKNE